MFLFFNFIFYLFIQNNKTQTQNKMDFLEERKIDFTCPRFCDINDVQDENFFMDVARIMISRFSEVSDQNNNNNNNNVMKHGLTDFGGNCHKKSKIMNFLVGSIEPIDISDDDDDDDDFGNGNVIGNNNNDAGDGDESEDYSDAGDDDDDDDDADDDDDVDAGDDDDDDRERDENLNEIKNEPTQNGNNQNTPCYYNFTAANDTKYHGNPYCVRFAAIDAYLCEKEHAREMLAAKGVAVVPNVLSPEFCKHIEDLTWTMFEKASADFTEHIPTLISRAAAGNPNFVPKSFDYYARAAAPPINRNDPETYKSFQHFSQFHGMLHHQHWMGHTEAAFKVREHENVIDVFSAVLGVPKRKLLCSVDGFSFKTKKTTSLKSQTSSAKEVLKQFWLHIDRGFTKKPKNNPTIQGYADILGHEPGQATFTFLEGSHLYFEEFKQRFGHKTEKNNHKLSDQELIWYISEKKCPIRTVVSAPGSFVLWNSDTVHCGGKPTFISDEHQKQRLVYYVCMEDGSNATRAQLERKRTSIEEKRTTTHQPIHFTLNDKNFFAHGFAPQESKNDYTYYPKDHPNSYLFGF